MQTHTCTVPSPVGAVTVVTTDDAVISIELDSDETYSSPQTPLLCEVCRQIDEYFAGVRFCFDVPILFSGTDFQRRVWDALRTIPYGMTASYSDVAAMINNPLAARAVGNAINKSRIALIIPCHRVINASGAVGLYGGGEHIKHFLLEFEASVFASSHRKN